VLARCDLDHGLIGRSAGHLVDGDEVMTGSQRPHDGCVAALVREQAHQRPDLMTRFSSWASVSAA